MISPRSHLRGGWTERGGAGNTHTRNQAHKGRQTDRQTDRQVDRPTDRQTDRQADRQTDRQTDGQAGRQTDRETGRKIDRQSGRHRQTDRQIDRQGKYHELQMWKRAEKHTHLQVQTVTNLYERSETIRMHIDTDTRTLQPSRDTAITVGTHRTHLGISVWNSCPRRKERELVQDAHALRPQVFWLRYGNVRIQVHVGEIKRLRSIIKNKHVADRDGVFRNFYSLYT